MKIVQSTWVRYHHFDLARELYQNGYLERIFTSLPWWKAEKESKEQGIPRELISCNFLMQGIRRVGGKVPGYTKSLDQKLACIETAYYANWVAENLPECDVYIGISGSGLKAGRLANSRGSAYIMDRGSTHIRYSDNTLAQEYKRWKIAYTPVDPWLIQNEEAESEEAKIITVPSDFVKKTFVEQGISPTKLKVIPYGVSLNEFYPVGEPSKSMFQVLFVGQCSLRKGIPYLLEAFKKFNHPNKELVIVGSISDEIRPLIAAIGTDKIKFVGTIPRNEVKKYMSQASVLVLPSIEEGLALVQAQAMACACPIIATPNTGCENLIEHMKNGLIIEAQNSSAITQALHQLADDPILSHSMRMANLESVKNLGGWKTYGRGIIETCSNLITQGL